VRQAVSFLKNILTKCELYDTICVKGGGFMLEPKINIFDTIEEMPREHYRFVFDGARLKKVKRKQALRFYIFILLGIMYFMWGMAHTFRDQPFTAGVMIGVSVFIVIMFSFALRRYCKSWAEYVRKLPATVYDYTVFGTFFVVWISSEDGIRQKKFQFTDIQKAQVVGEFVQLQLEGNLYLLEKDALAENSVFRSIARIK